MRFLPAFLFFSVIGMILVGGAGAADKPAATSASASAAAQAAPLPENAAEIAAIASGELVLEPLPAAEEAAGALALTPEMVEITTALAAEREQVDDLTARLRAATDDAAAVAFERQIEEAKQSAEIAILGIQARYARAAGHEEQAQAIEVAITQMSAVMNGIPAATTVPPAVTPDPHPADGSR